MGAVAAKDVALAASSAAVVTLPPLGDDDDSDDDDVVDTTSAVDTDGGAASDARLEIDSSTILSSLTRENTFMICRNKWHNKRTVTNTHDARRQHTRTLKSKLRATYPRPTYDVRERCFGHTGHEVGRVRQLADAEAALAHVPHVVVRQEMTRATAQAVPDHLQQLHERRLIVLSTRRLEETLHRPSRSATRHDEYQHESGFGKTSTSTDL